MPIQRKASFFLFICLLMICFVHTVHADDAVYRGDGIDVYPLENTDIQMVAEVITITRSGSDAFDVDVDMIFKNHGAQTTVQMGFPILADENEGERNEFDPHLRTWVNDKEVEIIKKRGVPNSLAKVPDPSDSVYTYPVTFGQNETIKIKHQYTVGGTIYSEGSWRFVYILRTGALWKDVIENMKIIYKTKSSSVHELKCTNPPNPIKEQHGDDTYFAWNLTNIKPKSDFIIEGNIRREANEGDATALGTCFDFNEVKLRSRQDEASASDSRFFQYHLNEDGTRDISIRLHGTMHIITLKKFQPEIVLPAWLVTMLLCGMLSYKNASDKNRDKRFWLIVGALTAPLTLLYIFFIPKKK